MRLGDAIVSVIAGAFADRVEIEVVLKIAADAVEIVDDGDARFAQSFRRPNAGELQQSRRTDGAAADDDLALGAQRFQARGAGDLHADGAAGFDVDPQRLRIEPDG